MNKSVIRRPQIIIATVIVVTVVFAFGLRRGLELDVSPLSFVARNSQERRDFADARKNFGVNRQIFYVSFGDFDTHSDAMRRQNALLSELSAAMSAFFNATAEMGVEKQVVTFTDSRAGDQPLLCALHTRVGVTSDDVPAWLSWSEPPVS